MKQYTHAHFILRCIEIARNGGQKVSPNPMVGSLLVENNEIIVSFYACGKSPINNLSNFSFIKQGIIYDGITYYSTEHAFQAQKYIKEQRHRFSIDGDLGNIETGFLLVFGNDKCEKKKQFWMKKDNIGIIAKMATNPKIGKKLGLIRDNNFISSD